MTRKNGTVAGEDVLEIQNLEKVMDLMSVEEIEEIEERLGAPIDAIMSPTQRKGKVLRAIVYVIKRRDHPGFTWDDAGKIRVRLDPSAAAALKAHISVPPTADVA